jgi:hypothetical protein
MPNPEIEEFANLLIQHVRDTAVRNCDRRLRIDATDPVAKRWKEMGGGETLASIADVLIPDIVDSTLAHLFRAIDQGLLPLSFTASNGKGVDLSVDGLGELAGSYMGSDGWRANYSKERFIDDFSDLK